MILSMSEELESEESEWRLPESLSECLSESLLSDFCESLRSELSLLELPLDDEPELELSR